MHTNLALEIEVSKESLLLDSKVFHEFSLFVVLVLFELGRVRTVLRGRDERGVEKPLGSMHPVDRSEEGVEFHGLPALLTQLAAKSIEDLQLREAFNQGHRISAHALEAANGSKRDARFPKHLFACEQLI